MHQRIAGEFVRGAAGVIAAIQSKQTERGACHQRCVGGQPYRDLIGQQERARDRGCRDGAGTGGHFVSQQDDACNHDERVQQVGYAGMPGSAVSLRNEGLGKPVRQRRLFQKGRARQLRNRIGTGLMHAPDDVRFAWLIGRPVVATENSSNP